MVDYSIVPRVIWSANAVSEWVDVTLRVEFHDLIFRI